MVQIRWCKWVSRLVTKWSQMCVGDAEIQVSKICLWDRFAMLLVNFIVYFRMILIIKGEENFQLIRKGTGNLSENTLSGSVQGHVGLSKFTTRHSITNQPLQMMYSYLAPPVRICPLSSITFNAGWLVMGWWILLCLKLELNVWIKEPTPFSGFPS